MTDTSAPGAAAAAPATTLTAAPKDSSAQMIVSLAIVAGMIVLGVGALIVADRDKSGAAQAWIVIGTLGGALANALQAPSGVASVIASARKAMSPNA